MDKGLAVFILMFGAIISGISFVMFFTRAKLIAFVLLLFGLAIIGFGSYEGGYFDINKMISITTNNIDLVKQSKVGTINYKLIEKYSNKDNIVNGFVNWYEGNNVNEVLSVPIIDGIGVDKSSILNVNSNYSKLFDGGDLFYDKNLNVSRFDSGDTYNLVFVDILRVGKIRDLVNENDRKYFFGNVCSFDSITTYNKNLCQVYSYPDLNMIKYNITSFAGEFSFPLSIMIVEPYGELKDAGLIFKWNETDRPEGNEYTSITFECIIGCNLIDTSKDYVDYWKNEKTINLGDIKYGTFELYRVRIKTNDIFIGKGTDIWKLTLDDLVSSKRVDIFGNRKALAVSEIIDGTY